MYVAVRHDYCAPMDSILQTSIPIVPSEAELGKHSIYRMSNNGFVFSYKC